MSTILQNSIWPNPDGNLGKNKTAIPDGVNVKWPEGDALIHNFVYKDGKLVGFVDTKALIVNDSKNTTIPYDCVNINLDNILEDTMTITQGERCKYLMTAYADVIEFLTPKLKELLGETKFELYFEKDAKKLIVHTDRIADDMIASLENLLDEVLPQTIETEKYNHHIDISWRDINKYAECTTVAEMRAVNPDYKNDLTSDGGWVYPLPALSNAKDVFLGNTKLCFFDADYETPVVGNYSNPFWSYGAYWFKNCPNLKSFKMKKIRFKTIWETFYNCSSFSEFKADISECKAINNCFVNCILNKDSAIHICNNVGTPGSDVERLMLGIHIDHQNDEEVLAAIATAEAKGWQLTVRWNGTPTAATASTFGFSQLIYAKVGEMERPDGTTERVLDWGHYVTDETGYETFRSLESAYEHFGLEMTE